MKSSAARVLRGRFTTPKSLLALGVSGVCGWASYRCYTLWRDERRVVEATRESEREIAQWSKDVALTALSDTAVLDLVVDVLRDAFFYPSTKEVLKQFFHKQFTENEQTLRDVQMLVVDCLLSDPWIRDTLLLLCNRVSREVAGDAADMAGDAALEGLAAPDIHDAAAAHILVAFNRALPFRVFR